MASAVVCTLALYVALLHERDHEHADYMPTVLSIALFLIAIGLLGFATWRNLKDSKRAQSLHAQIFTIKEEHRLELDDIERKRAAQLKSIADRHAYEIKVWEHANDVELKKTQEFRKEYWDKKNALDQQGLDGLLNPLQIKAIILAKQLRILAEIGVTGCSASEFNRMRLEYEKTFAPQIKTLMYEFAREGGENSTLRRFSEFADNGSDILNVARELIRLAYIQDGIDIDTRYPS